MYYANALSFFRALGAGFGFGQTFNLPPAWQQWFEQTFPHGCVAQEVPESYKLDCQNSILYVPGEGGFLAGYHGRMPTRAGEPAILLGYGDDETPPIMCAVLQWPTLNDICAGDKKLNVATRAALRLLAPVDQEYAMAHDMDHAVCPDGYGAPDLCDRHDAARAGVIGYVARCFNIPVQVLADEITRWEHGAAWYRQ